ncbi:MAG: acyltransferase [Proteobacteria bacterium]|nr:acyltransferase [Pseudomonadota bacterium]
MDQLASAKRDDIRADRITATGKDEIGALTGIRGVAAAAVITYHIFPATFMPWGISQLFARGYMAVDVFFVLSGFVMALNYGPMFRGGFRLPAGMIFLMRRVARLYPLYITFLALRVGYSLLVYHRLQVPDFWFAMDLDHPARDLIANVLMIQSWGIAPAITNPTWSISTEWGAYFLFPLLVSVTLFRRWQTMLVAGLVAAALVVVVSILTAYSEGHNGPLDAYDGRTLLPMMRCLGGFTLGLITFRLYRWAPAARVASAGAGWAVIAYIMGGLILRLPDIAIYPAFPLLVLCLACDKGPLGRFFAWKPIFELGVLSYTIYVIHNVWIGPVHWMQKALPTQMPDAVAQTVVVAGLILSLGAAAIALHRWVEVPGRRIVRHVLG